MWLPMLSSSTYRAPPMAPCKAQVLAQSTQQPPALHPLRRQLSPSQCLAPASRQGHPAPAQPDLELPPPPGGASIHLFGAVHGDAGSDIAEFILRHRPATVVVETALNTAHGSATGNVALLEDCLSITGPGGYDARTLTLARLGAQLASSPDPLTTSLWADISRSRAFASEHLAYVAAFATNARLLFGDRPKLTTYQRMLWCPDVADLDAGYGVQSALNYAHLVPDTPLPTGGVDVASPTGRIFMAERDAVLLGELHQASLMAGEGQAVVGVVGASHVAGMEQLWTSGGWRKLLQEGAQEVPMQRGGGEESLEALGVRRALFDAVIRLCCRQEVTWDIAATLGPPPAGAMQAYELTLELYGSSRMLLAVLESEQLQAVCSGWRCDMWDLLAPLRAVRPVNGGPGFDEELVMELRQLNYELGPPASAAN